YAEVAGDIAGWVRNEMTHAEGGFYSAQDADDPGGPEGEGVFYTWSPQEIRELFGQRESEVVLIRFGVTPEGNWIEHGQHRRRGRTILEMKKTAEQVAGLLELETGAVDAILARAVRRMYEAREKRPKPMTDTKVLTGWNGLMISGLCRAYQMLGEREHLAAARSAGRFVRRRLTGSDGRLRRRWREGEAAHDAVLDDYAYVIAAYLDLYECTFETAWLEEALRLSRLTLDLFHDEKGGAFFYTARDAEQLLARGKQAFDNARPSGNAVMAMNLLRISELTGDPAGRSRARRTIDTFGTQVTGNSLGFGAMLNALDFAQPGTREIFIAGPPDHPATRALVEAVWRNPDPNRVLALVRPGLDELLPPARGRVPVDGKPAAYVCRNFTCDAPTTNPEDLR
ncbi:MAG: thioredoxin domain-containing protein, partial [Planctomycetota bacterium]